MKTSRFLKKLWKLIGAQTPESIDGNNISHEKSTETCNFLKIFLNDESLSFSEPGLNKKRGKLGGSLKIFNKFKRN